ncbi:MAG TPA: glycoside hydrolase family 3 N-terminal domain-containing protein [Ilumatobacter sp.]|nr:glycoside hydrolase family 3 N-terminal domain-containing protein [Ilumatobacter sp.]
MTLPSTPSAPDDTAPYRDPTAGIDDRVADLLGRMTLDDKLGQLGSAWVFQLAGADGFDAARATPLLAHGIGQVTRISGASSLGVSAAAELANAIQQHLREHTRLGIPALVHEEICSGLMAREATVFAQALGVAATFRPEYNRAIADSIRLQMRSIGAHQGLSPVLDICRDPRWGRLEETYGEDPLLVSRMGVEFVLGLQGPSLATGVIATLKHFVGYGASEGGLNWAPAHLPERELRDVYLRPFEAAVREAGAASVMNGYHELDGVPCGANRWLLTDVLRTEWGFVGCVVADYFAVKQLDVYHHVVGSPDEAAAAALRAGLDIELPGTDCYAEPLRRALDRGLVSLAELDTAVARALRQKFALGLFEQPFVDTGALHVHTRTADQLALARQVAADSLVLVKNDGVLPLGSGDAGPARVAVVGPSAASARNLLGDYSYLAHVESLLDLLKSGNNVFAMPLEHGADVDEQLDLAHVGTVLDQLTERLAGADVTYAPGCDVNSTNRSGFAAAVAAAAAADVAVVVVGDKSGLTVDATSGESRDAAYLTLPGVQEQLVLDVAATGTPVVLVIVGGRPMGSPAVHDACAAVLMAWLPGEQGAAAIADVVLGTVSPGGKLPVTWPRSSGQIPVFYAHKVSGGRSHWKGPYVDESNHPLYPFGHGLSYSSFALSDLSVEPAQLPVDTADGLDAEVVVTATLTNTGAVRADEVVQLYASDPVASVTRSVRELQAFLRVTLDPGASAQVTLAVSVRALGFTGRELHYGVEPGDVEFHLGTSATDTTPVGSVRLTGDTFVPAVRTTAFSATARAV